MFPWHATLLLGFESSNVIGKRLFKISLGGRQSFDEVQLMIAEKADAARSASMSIMHGCTMGVLIEQYRALVAANDARLSV